MRPGCLFERGHLDTDRPREPGNLAHREIRGGHAEASLAFLAHCPRHARRREAEAHRDAARDDVHRVATADHDRWLPVGEQPLHHEVRAHRLDHAVFRRPRKEAWDRERVRETQRDRELRIVERLCFPDVLLGHPRVEPERHPLLAAVVVQRRPVGDVPEPPEGAWTGVVRAEDRCPTQTNARLGPERRLAGAVRFEHEARARRPPQRRRDPGGRRPPRSEHDDPHRTSLAGSMQNGLTVRVAPRGHSAWRSGIAR